MNSAGSPDGIDHWRRQEPRFAVVVDYLLSTGVIMCGMSSKGPSAQAIVELLKFKDQMWQKKLANTGVEDPHA